MIGAANFVVDLIFGRWRSQILYAGVELGVFDQLAEGEARSAVTLAAEIEAEPDRLYRLMRALASIGLLAEDAQGGFRLTEAGAMLREDHPNSLRAITLLEEGPEHYAIWKHLAAILREGGPDGFLREFGAGIFDYARQESSYAGAFNQAMTSYSAVQTQWALAALAGADLSGIRHFCDVAGGHGHLACAMAAAYPHVDCTVFDLPSVVGDTDRLLAAKLSVADRCRYVGGDMFQAVPGADAYLLKNVLHDWSDEDCGRLLANLRQAVTGAGRLFVIEHVVPGHEEPHFAKIFDIHMMCATSGRERTLAELTELLTQGGWRFEATYQAPGALQSVIAGTAI